MKTMFYRIEGIRCVGCVSRIKVALNALGIQSVDFDIASHTLTISTLDTSMEPKTIMTSIKELGYTCVFLSQKK